MSPFIYAVFFFFQSLGNSQREYEKHVLLYSIRNQLRFRNNLGEIGYFTDTFFLFDSAKILLLYVNRLHLVLFK